MSLIANAVVTKGKSRYYALGFLGISLVFGLLVAKGIIPHEHQTEAFGYIHEALLLPVGMYLFFNGFEILRRKRLIENTPTSKIRSVAMGIAEIVGFAREKFPLKSPITATECACFKFLIEKETRDSKGRTHWTTVHEGASTTYFYVEDTTGKLLVDPLSAELLLVRDYYETKGSPRYRYSEWRVEPGDYLYILGSVRKFADADDDRRAQLRDRLQKLKENKNELMKFDADRDGQINVEEWDRARAAVEQQLLEEELKKPAENSDDLVLAKGDAEKAFIISDRDEKDVCSNLTWRSLGYTVSGGAMIVVLLISMLTRAHVAPGFVIPWQAFYK